MRKIPNYQTESDLVSAAAGGRDYDPYFSLNGVGEYAWYDYGNNVVISNDPSLSKGLIYAASLSQSSRRDGTSAAAVDPNNTGVVAARAGAVVIDPNVLDQPGDFWRTVAASQHNIRFFGPGLTHLTHTNPWTIIFWINATVPGVFKYIMASSFTTTLQTLRFTFNFVGGINYLRCSLTRTTGTRELYVQVPYDIYSGGWHRVTVTYDGTQTIPGLKMYIDNNSLGSVTTIGAPFYTVNAATLYYMCGYNNVAYYLNADVKQAFFFNRVLSPDEVARMEYVTIREVTFKEFGHARAGIFRNSQKPDFNYTDIFRENYDRAPYVEGPARGNYTENVKFLFSSPGDKKTARGGLDKETRTVSGYNALPWRNLAARAQIDAATDFEEECSTIPADDSGYVWIANASRQ